MGPSGEIGPRTSVCLFALIALSLCGYSRSSSDLLHTIVLKEDVFVVHWTPDDTHVTFEIVAATHGFVGLGFSPNGRMQNADFLIGWVQDGIPFVQDRFGTGNSEPQLDEQQDWEVLWGFENETHTVLRVRRVLQTCDRFDRDFTADTVRLMYAFHDSDPVLEEEATEILADGSQPRTKSRQWRRLPYHGIHQRGYRSVYLLEKPVEGLQTDSQIGFWEFRNPNVSLPQDADTLYWCKIFPMPDMGHKKQHVIRYEPAIEPGHEEYIHHIIVYECGGSAVAEHGTEALETLFQEAANSRGHVCNQPNMPPVFFYCNIALAAWAIGSEGFSLPPEAGYPINAGDGPKFLMMETHFDNRGMVPNLVDNSGLRFYYTPNLRPNDAGVVSLGMHPNWRHLIPPGQSSVISQGHCVSTCTDQGLPRDGVNIFATILHTHPLGEKITLRQIRNGTELLPITEDRSYDFNYQEYRLLNEPRRVMPGDHLITECSYNSRKRNSITLGGFSTREEMCLIYAFYYPKAPLSVCYSLPSQKTVFESLGITELYPATDSTPVRIKNPPALRDMTLEERLLTYDWKTNFNHFQEVTRKGAFKPICFLGSEALVTGSEKKDYYTPRIERKMQKTSACARTADKMRKLPYWMKEDSNNMFGDDSQISSNTRDTSQKNSYPGPAEAVQSGSSSLYPITLNCLFACLSMVFRDFWLFTLPIG